MATGQTILIVEPQTAIRETKMRILERNGYQTVGVASVSAAFARSVGRAVSLVLLDLPEDRVAWTALDAIRSRDPRVPVIVMQRQARLEDAVESLKRGAADYLPKSLDPAQLLRSVREALQSRAAVDAPSAVGLIERSAAMRDLMRQVRRVAPSGSNILLCGESGVGKEVVARYIHGISPRGSRDFVAINCASLSDDMLENELFGHERGAFTSANERKPGVFELADGGTLFLDEVGEMGLRSQAKVLRAIERREFRRVGGTKKVKVDVRIVAATNTDLREAVATHRFREDLYYRLDVVNLCIPPLRERREVIPDMIEQFLTEFGKKASGRLRRVSPEALGRLVEYEWPGNVRELRNVIESLVLTAPGTRIEAGDLPPTIREVAARREVRLRVGLSMAEIEREVFQAYVETYGSKKEAAKVLEIALRTFHAKAKRYGLQKSRAAGTVRDAAAASHGMPREAEVQIRHDANPSGATESADIASSGGQPRSKSRART
jgi:DNA-binding NtrC family response regulator